jgi:hypothetical protein
MTPGLYRANLAAKEEFERRDGLRRERGRGKEVQVVGRRGKRKDGRGEGRVGGRESERGGLSGEMGGEMERMRNGESGERSEGDCEAGEDCGEKQCQVSEKEEETATKAQFDKDLECLDISDDDTLDGLVKEDREILSVDDDEYILL